MAHKRRKTCVDKFSSYKSPFILDVHLQNLKCILHVINCGIFNFLWALSLEHSKFHLISQERVAKSKDMGGWGSKNIYLFSKVLNVNSLQMALFVDNLWHCIIMAKYFKNIMIDHWIRFSKKCSKGTSYVWNNISLAFNIMGKWLSLFLARGDKI